MGYVTPGGLVNKIIDPFPLAQHWIQAFTLFNGLVGSGGVDFKGCLTVHPVVGAAKTGSFGADRTDVIGRKRLAQGAGVINFLCLVRHVLNPLIPFLVIFFGPFRQFGNIRFLGVKGNLDLVEDFTEILMELGMQDNTDIF